MGEEALFHAMVAPPVTMASLQPWNPVTLAFQVRTATLSGRTFFLPAFFCVTRPGSRAFPGRTADACCPLAAGEARVASISLKGSVQ